MVAQDDVQRQREADKKAHEGKIIDIRSRMDKAKADAALKAHQTNTNAEIEKRQQDIDERREQLRMLLDTQKLAQDAQQAEEDRVSRETIAENRDNTQLTIAGDRTQSTENVAFAGQDTQQSIAEAGHQSAEKIAEDRNEATVQAAKLKPKPSAGGSE